MEKITLDEILEIVSGALNISIPVILGKLRLREVVFARMLFTYLAKKYCHNCNISEIMRKIKKDHAAFYYYYYQIIELSKLYEDIRVIVDKCENEILNKILWRP